MKKATLLSLFTAAFFSSGCTPIYTKHEAKLIVYKTAKLSYADAGFIHSNSEDDLKIEILIVGQPAFTLELGRKICLDGACLKKSKWIRENLSPHYPQELLQNVFLGKPIFGGERMIKKSQGFEQKLYKKDAFDISYRVTAKAIRFKDKITKILIKTKEIEQ